MKIGELAAITGVSVPTIRLYEREGLISRADRSEGRFRLFDATHEVRLRFIKQLRSLGFTLDEIREILSGFGVPADLAFLARVELKAVTKANALAAFIKQSAAIRAGEANPDAILSVFENAGMSFPDPENT